MRSEGAQKAFHDFAAANSVRICEKRETVYAYGLGGAGPGELPGFGCEYGACPTNCQSPLNFRGGQLLGSRPREGHQRRRDGGRCRRARTHARESLTWWHLKRRSGVRARE
jgi:hypothetical protein